MMSTFRIVATFLIIIVLQETGHSAIIAVNSGDSIQAAIYTARPGDIIEVHSGVYYEHVNINKQLTLRGVGMPVLDATASGSAITLRADGVILEGFRTINSGQWPGEGAKEAGIKVISRNNTIINNNASNNSNGIFIIGGGNNTITGNTANNNLGFGIMISNSSKNIIFRNNFDRDYGNCAYDNGANTWDNGSVGNYYGNFDSSAEGCKDVDSNGKCDSFYAIPGGISKDSYPSMIPF